MRVAALLSGGKDSVAAVEVAQAHGWEVVVALRMLPAEDDAYMFHTPNLGVVEAVADCLGIPLESESARPDPLQEVNDLEQALARLKEVYSLDGVVSGALASDYQRTRIDAVGERVGLKTFAPLWHKDPLAHMEALLQGGYDIRFSRVACDGLGPEWAGRRLDGEALAFLRGLHSRPDIAGEGGEYETLVLDAPHYYKRIVVEAAEVEATASRATWHVQAWHVEGRP